MLRVQKIRLIVLSHISDDYENIDQCILSDVRNSCGRATQRSEVVNALASLVADGLAKAYTLSHQVPPRELHGMPSVDQVEEYFETYFYATPEGIELQGNSDWLEDSTNIDDD